MFLYSAETRGFYIKGLNNIPPDVVEVSRELYDELFAAQSKGSAIVPNDSGYPVSVQIPEIDTDQVSIENSWILTELERIRNELEKVQDSDPKAVGTVSQWREYRKLIRAWCENEKFPNKDFRPKSPDFKE